MGRRAPDAALAGLHELLPWLIQWHNELRPESRRRAGRIRELPFQPAH